VFEDEGYSGGTLVRPGLETLRDLAAQGEIEAVLVYSPDRLSRKYAYQVLLAEEFSRCGVTLVFLHAPSGQTPEDRLVVQFQGMIAEHESAQILERYRRGKRDKARLGMVSVLSGAPYGYRYLRKSDSAEASYQVIDHEADVVTINSCSTSYIDGRFRNHRAFRARENAMAMRQQMQARSSTPTLVLQIT
jgi:site-specific DNA recombinase